MREECDRYGMPLVIWAYPRGRDIEKKGGQNSFYAIDYAARLAMEMGADVVKLNLPKLDPEKAKDSPAPYNEMDVTPEEAMRHIVESAGRSLVVLSGGSKTDDETVLSQHPHDHGGRRLGRDLRPQRLAARVERGAGDHRADQGDAALQRAAHSLAAPAAKRRERRRGGLAGSGDATNSRADRQPDAAGAAGAGRLHRPRRRALSGERPVDGERTLRANVTRVIDGDTIEVSIGGQPDEVRYIGVDTPETVKPGTPVECFGPQASACNHRLVERRTVRLVFDRERRDVYGRLLAYVYVGKDFVNAGLVRLGYARTLTIPPNVAHAGLFHRLGPGRRPGGARAVGSC